MLKKLHTVLILLIAALLALSSCASADWNDVKYRLSVRTDQGLSRRDLARKVWRVVQPIARDLGFRTRSDFEEDLEHADGASDELLYEIELGEIKIHDDADLKLYVRCRRKDKSVVSATLTWEAEEERDKHAELYNALAAHTELFLPPAK